MYINRLADVYIFILQQVLEIYTPAQMSYTTYFVTVSWIHYHLFTLCISSPYFFQVSHRQVPRLRLGFFHLSHLCCSLLPFLRSLLPCGRGCSWWLFFRLGLSQLLSLSCSSCQVSLLQLQVQGLELLNQLMVVAQLSKAGGQISYCIKI